ncbi:MAG: alpha/beta family hydrolase [Candidatus Marinimicrobia bacterium]|nr:alpha/beta family hydrolase [Candidatus Neomarinimicrobiota bacterium]
MKKIQNILYPFKKAELLVDYNIPKTPSDVTLVLGHGKYNDMNTPLFDHLAKILPKENVNFVRFNYPFTEHARKIINRKKCKIAFKAVLEDVKSELPDTKFLFIGGKSLSAIISSQIKHADVLGYVFLTYPLHLPVLRFKFTRKALFQLKKPMMFVSGTEDKFADRELLELLMGALNPHAHLMMIPNTGHSLELMSEEKRTQKELFKEISDILLWFMSDVIEKRMKN